jgi:hypothetical protein
MIILFWGSALFVFAFLLHLMLWKIRVPKRQTKAILQIFLAVLFIGIIILWNMPNDSVLWQIALPVGLLEYIHIVLFFISLKLAYMITYSAIEADSPSLVIMMAIANAEPKGLEKKDFDELMTDDKLVKPRIKDILLNKMAEIVGDKYVLTPKGAVFVGIFIIYRKIMKISRKGG